MAEWYDNENMGSAFPIPNYGINTLANKFNKYAGSNQRLDYDQGLSDWGSTMGNVPDAPSMPPMLDQTGQMGAYTNTPRAPQNPIFDPAQGNRGRWSQQNVPDETGIMENLKNKLSGFTTPALSFLKKIGGKRSPEKQAFYDEVMQGRSVAPWQTGTYKGNQYGLYNSPSGLKVSSDVLGWGEGYEKNLDSAFGSKSIEEMEQKQLDWFRDRVRKGKSISQRGYGLLDKHGYGGGNIGDQRPGRTITETVEGVTRPGEGASTYRGPPTASFNRAQAVKAGSYDRTAGPMSGSYGPHSRRADGGRIGYQEGELVEDEYMAEATPGGMMEENIEEVQGEPTREQLEAIALEIFRLPLEELNEEQLNVVYQAAMEQEPAEEEIQFAAQEGPGEGIASLV